MSRALPAAAAQARTLVSCLLLRAAYGGMAGDIAMLRSAAEVWLRRFQSHPDTEAPAPPTLQADGHHRSAAGNGLAWGRVWTAIFQDCSIPWAVLLLLLHMLSRCWAACASQLRWL